MKLKDFNRNWNKNSKGMIRRSMCVEYVYKGDFRKEEFIICEQKTIREKEEKTQKWIEKKYKCRKWWWKWKRQTKYIRRPSHWIEGTAKTPISEKQQWNKAEIVVQWSSKIRKRKKNN